jgi:hypothetical protein
VLLSFIAVLRVLPLSLAVEFYFTAPENQRQPKPKMLLLLRRSLPPLSRSAAAFCCFLGVVTWPKTSSFLYARL